MRKLNIRYDYAGKRFYSLVGIRRTEGEQKFKSSMWVWKCDCGDEVSYFSRDVMMGRRKACEKCEPINRKTTYIGDGVAAYNSVYRRYKKEARSRGYEFELDSEDVAYITKQNCHYCGKPPSTKTGTKNATGFYLYNGIDRVDNSKGYYIDNVVPCCTECNYSKRNRGYFQFVEWVHKISTRFIAAGVS